MLKECILLMKCQVLLVIPRLDRQERDILNLTSNHQILTCNFCTDRHSIKPTPPGSLNNSYQTFLNQIYFQRYPPSKNLPDKVYGELKENGLYFNELHKMKNKDVNINGSTKKKFKLTK